MKAKRRAKIEQYSVQYAHKYKEEYLDVVSTKSLEYATLKYDEKLAEAKKMPFFALFKYRLLNNETGEIIKASDQK